MNTEHSERAGQLPGSIISYDESIPDDVTLTIFDYDEKAYSEIKTQNVEECFKPKKKNVIRWINIDGLKRGRVIEEIGKHYNLHPLLQEDIASIDQRPKLEEFPDYLLFIVKMLSYDDIVSELRFEQVSIVLNKDTVITFQDKPGDVFDPIRERIRNNRGLIRQMGADYLAYSLLDIIVDNYFVILEKIGDKLEDLEDEVVAKPLPETIHAIHDLKKDMILLRKSVWPLRDVVSHLERCGSELISDTTHLYLRDVYDHTIQVIDSVETYRDIIAGTLDIYVSSMSNKLNEIMKFLTIVGTIFIPLTFISGVYGMNFHFMPELEQWWGYPLTLIIMALTGSYMIWYIRKKKWM